jgi:hypothetical protein
MASNIFRGKTAHIFKRKKRKRKPSFFGSGFQKSQFFKKNTTPCGWRFFLKPAGPELAFLKSVADLFFLFIVFILKVEAQKFPSQERGIGKLCG